MTAIDKGLSLIRAASANQQLYKIVIDILFYQATYFKSVIPKLDGIHMLMNFSHASTVIMMIFSRAGHKGDWALHLYAADAILSFFVQLAFITMLHTTGNWNVSLRDNHCHVYTSTDGRKLSNPRHFKMRNGLCRLLFFTKQMLSCHT